MPIWIKKQLFVDSNASAAVVVGCLIHIFLFNFSINSQATPQMKNKIQ
jgi:hypothetical protein